MPDVHLTFDLLAARERGELDDRGILWFVVNHLAVVCPACGHEILAHMAEEERLRAGGGAPPAAGEEALSEARRAAEMTELHDLPPEAREELAAFAEELQESRERFQAERPRGEAEARELTALVDSGPEGAEEALARVRRARTRFRTPHAGFSLVTEAALSLPDRPRRALALARLAVAVADRMPDPGSGPKLLRGALAGLALAHQGNALRALDDLAGAHRRFAHARMVLDQGWVSTPRVLAEVDALEGSLRRAQRRFAEAERLLRRAAAHWTAAGEPLGRARALLTLGVLYQQWNRPAEALGAAEAALRALPAGAPRRVRLCAEHNRVDCLCDLGHPEVAAELLAEARPLYRGFDDPWTRLRLAWVEGRIAAGLGDPGAARERLGAAREGFIEAGSVYDTALVSLELAQVELGAGRPAEARRLAAATADLFTALEVPREAAAALAQLGRAARDGAEEEAVTATLLRRTLRALRSSKPS